MPNQIMQDKYILGQSIAGNINSVGDEIKLDVSLKPNLNVLNGGKINGTITNSMGTPIANAIVKIMSTDYIPLVHTISDVNGKYSFINIVPNRSYNIFAKADGMKLKQANQFSITTLQQLTINFVLEDDPAMKLGIITGDLINFATLLPINGAIISLFNNDLNGNQSLQAVVYTNEYGQFVFREIPLGDYLLKISALGYNDNNARVSINSQGQISSIKITLTPNQNVPNGTVSGMITDNNSQPINEADVVLYKVNKTTNELTPIAFTKTNVNGIYLFSNVPPGMYKVKANEIGLVASDAYNYITYSPQFDSFIVSKKMSYFSSLIYSSDAILTNGAIFDKTSNLIGFLGGPTNGSAQFDVNVQVDGIYDIYVKYISADAQRPLKVIINKQMLASTYLSEKTLGSDIVYVKTLIITTTLVSGTNNIIFTNDTGDYSPSIGDIQVRLSYPIVNVNSALEGSLNNGATTQLSGSFIGLIGDAGGYSIVPITVSSSGEYSLLIQYLSGDKDRTLKLDINGVYTGNVYTLTKTNSFNKVDANIFTVTVKLNSGYNTIKFYNDTGVATPWIGGLQASLNYISTSASAVTGDLTGGAVLTWNGQMVGSIGGPNANYVNVNVSIPVSGKYVFGIKYLTGVKSGSNLKIDLNDKILGTYKLPYTGANNINDSRTAIIISDLNAGMNKFKFYNDTGEWASNISNLTFKLIDPLVIFNNATTGSMQNGATLVWSNKLVGFLGGPNNGSVEITQNIGIQGNYIMEFSYISEGLNENPIKIDVNGILLGSYILPKTNNNYITDAMKYMVVLNLNKGVNKIKFYNDTVDYSANLGEIKLTRLTAFFNKYEAESVTLSESANIKNGMVTGIGSNGGYLKISVNVPESGDYDLGINYLTTASDSVSNIDVNGIAAEKAYEFIPTDSWDRPNIKTKAISVTLNKGNNIIKIYNK